MHNPEQEILRWFSFFSTVTCCAWRWRHCASGYRHFSLG